ncbi:MAG: hypothetical protein R3311_14965, partial [Oceanisphaera sp.]|nr:hypothetical protein [Oceanisphaera sp.]
RRYQVTVRLTGRAVSTAVPHKSKTIAFDAYVTAISRIETANGHEVTEKEFSSFPRKRESLNSSKTLQTILFCRAHG